MRRKGTAMATTIDTGTGEVLAEVADGVGTITLNRPERRNAMSDAMLSVLGPTLARLERDPDVGVVVLTGAGGAFCAGGDVKGMAERGGLLNTRVASGRYPASRLRAAMVLAS